MLRYALCYGMVAAGRLQAVSLLRYATPWTHRAGQVRPGALGWRMPDDAPER